MFQLRIALSSFNWLLHFAFYVTATLEYSGNNASVTVILELLIALLEYLDFLNGFVQSAYFLAVKASLSPQNASIIPDSYTCHLCWHNCLIPIYTSIRKNL